MRRYTPEVEWHEPEQRPVRSFISARVVMAVMIGAGIALGVAVAVLSGPIG